MAFSTRRGRPPKIATPTQDAGTAELRLKHALGLTREPIDRCLERQLITPAQHWCGLHLRWLYTIRYGAPVVTSHALHDGSAASRSDDDPLWRHEREQEYRTAVGLLHRHRHYDGVMRLCVYNESPVFLSEALRQRAWQHPAVAEQLSQAHRTLQEGLEILATHWKRR